jgi:hypothetical protein
MSRVLTPLGYCAYCGATGCRLTDEHVVPLSLNGTLVLPRASCDACADVTKRFEQTVARSMYGVLRLKRGFSTRRKRERPTHVSAVAVSEAGLETETTVPVSLLPTTYIALELPPPGILTGAPLSTMNPELKLHLKGDKAEIATALRALEAGTIELSADAMWGPFCRLLAKIAHTFATGVLRGNGYVPLLPDLILGRSQFLSHFVGGATGEMPSGDLWLALLPVGSELYVSVGMALLGPGRLPPYQAIAGRVTDPEAIIAQAQPK